MARETTLGDFGAGVPEEEDDEPRELRSPHPPELIECNCRICSDETITICLDEAHRLLQISY